MKTGTDRLMIVDLAKHIITGVQGPTGETVAPSCPSDVFPGA